MKIRVYNIKNSYFKMRKFGNAKICHSVFSYTRLFKWEFTNKHRRHFSKNSLFQTRVMKITKLLIIKRHNDVTVYNMADSFQLLKRDLHLHLVYYCVSFVKKRVLFVFSRRSICTTRGTHFIIGVEFPNLEFPRRFQLEHSNLAFDLFRKKTKQKNSSNVNN